MVPCIATIIHKGDTFHCKRKLIFFSVRQHYEMTDHRSKTNKKLVCQIQILNDSNKKHPTIACWFCPNLHGWPWMHW